LMLREIGTIQCLNKIIRFINHWLTPAYHGKFLKICPLS
jgi:hypothetical protein